MPLKLTFLCKKNTVSLNRQGTFTARFLAYIFSLCESHPRSLIAYVLQLFLLREISIVEQIIYPHNKIPTNAIIILVKQPFTVSQ